MRRITLFVLTALVFALGSATAHATPVTYAYTATFQFAPINGLSGVNIGDQITGIVSWDTSVADSDPGEFGVYVGGLSMTFNVGGYSFAASNGTLTIVNDFVNGGLIYDSFLMDFASLSGPAGNPFDGGSAFFGMSHALLTTDASTVTPYNSTAIPTTLDLADFPALPPYSSSPELFIRQSINANPGVIGFGYLDSITLIRQDDATPAPVPEPGTMSLVGFGAAWLARRRFRQRR